MAPALLLAALALPAADRPAPPPDLVVLNGRLWTVCRARPEAEALAVRAGRIVAVGRTADVRALAGPRTRVLDLHGRRALPGFYDAHVHFLGGGLALARVALKDAADLEEFGRRLRAFDRAVP